MAVNFSEFHVKNNLCGKKTTYVKNSPLCLRKKTWYELTKKNLVALAEKTHQTVEGKAPVLRIICKGLENGL